MPLVGRYFYEVYLDGEKAESPLPFPDMVVSSVAIRALETAKYFKSAFEVPNAPLPMREEDDLYQAKPEFYLELVRKFSDQLDHVLIVGHNPTISEFIQRMQPTELDDDLPTCGGVILKFSADVWSAVEWGEAERIGAFSPRGIQRQQRRGIGR